MTPELVAAVSQFGPLGLMIAYLAWEKRAEREHRREVELARADSDKALATSLAALTVMIEHKLPRGL